jgi:hypothetical protein
MSHTQRHPIPTSRTCYATTRLQNIGLAQGLQAAPQRHTLNEVHVARPKAPDSTPPCMFHHRTSRQPSSSQPKLEGNIATFHSQRGSCRTPKGTRHCFTLQVSPPRHRRQPPSTVDHHPHASSICPCAAHSAWGVGVVEDIGGPPVPSPCRLVTPLYSTF